MSREILFLSLAFIPSLPQSLADNFAAQGDVLKALHADQFTLCGSAVHPSSQDILLYTSKAAVCAKRTKTDNFINAVYGEPVKHPNSSRTEVPLSVSLCVFSCAASIEAGKVKYDDGKDPKGLPKADIVLLGISRTSKTPLSQYLAHKSYKVMNVPDCTRSDTAR